MCSLRKLNCLSCFLKLSCSLRKLCFLGKLACQSVLVSQSGCSLGKLGPVILFPEEMPSAIQFPQETWFSHCIPSGNLEQSLCFLRKLFPRGTEVHCPSFTLNKSTTLGRVYRGSSSNVVLVVVRPLSFLRKWFPQETLSMFWSERRNDNGIEFPEETVSSMVTFGLLNLRTIEPSDYWTLGLLNRWTIEP